MTAMFPRPSAILMGPQRLAPVVDKALDLLDVTGEVAVITAGWQEREEEDGELCDALGGRSAVNLLLHARGDTVYQEDAELFSLHRAKQDQLKRMQMLYRRRLEHAMAAATEMQGLRESASSIPRELVDPQLEGAIEWIRQLDEEHARRVADVEARFKNDVKPLERDVVKRQRDELHRILDGCEAVAIAGGHVAVLLNKLQLFGLADKLATKPVVAWSAGAMVLTERIVLFHDSPPQGRGFAEMLCRGLGVMPNVLVLPHARRRLLLDDRQRISLFARRFSPHACVTLDENCYVSYYVGSLGQGMWRANDKARRLTLDGECMSMEVS